MGTARVLTALVGLFAVVAFSVTESGSQLLGRTAGRLVDNFGWLYILGVTVFLVFLIGIALSRYGRVRLGGPDSRPEYGNLAWFAMLFATGMLAILLLRGATEPLAHYVEPPRGDVSPQSVGAVEAAMGYSLYHFGLHVWAIFCLPALTLAYVAHRRGLPLRISSALHPLIGERVHGPIGKLVDGLAAMCTLLAVALLVALGVAGRLLELPVLGIVVALAVVSIVAKRGLVRIAAVNLGLAAVLLLFVLFAGSTSVLPAGIVETTGTYLARLVPTAFWSDTFADTGWLSTWTVFYWVWAIALSPYVGSFIARISKGRTIRELVLGVLVLPTAFTVVWFSVFGLSAIEVRRAGDAVLGDGAIEAGFEAGVLFDFLDTYPMAGVATVVAAIVVVLCYATGVGAVGLVMEPAGRAWRRIGWVLVVSGLAGVLVVAGNTGLLAQQNALVLVGLPFLLNGFLWMYALIRALRKDFPEPRGEYRGEADRDTGDPVPVGGPGRVRYNGGSGG